MDPIQNPIQEPVQTPVEIPTPQSKPNYLIIIITSIAGIIFLTSSIFLYFQNQKLKTELKVMNFKDCSAVKGALLRESYPAVCVLPSGKTFTQELTEEEKLKLIPPKDISAGTSSISISPDATAEWKTYTSLKANYSFKYPDSWPVVQVPVSISCTTCIENIPFSLSYDPQSADSELAVVLVFKDPRIKTLDDYKNTIIKGDSSIIDVQDVIISTEKAVSYKLSGGIPPLPIIEYVVVKNNFYYVIRLINSKETNKNLVQNQKTFNQILSTFKFTNSSVGITKERKIGYIKSINNNYVSVDLIEMTDDKNQPNGYKIDNPSSETTNYPLTQNPSIILLSYKDNSLNNFIEAFKSNPLLKTSPFWLDIENGKITKITEQYIP